MVDKLTVSSEYHEGTEVETKSYVKDAEIMLLTCFNSAALVLELETRTGRSSLRYDLEKHDRSKIRSQSVFYAEATT